MPHGTDAAEAKMAKAVEQHSAPVPMDSQSPTMFAAASIMTGRAVGMVVQIIGNLGNYASALRERASSSASSAVKPAMEKKKNRVTVEERQRWMQRQDACLAAIKRDPARAEPSEAHADVAVFEEWLDGSVSDEYLNAYMRQYEGCERCQAAYQHYKNLKATSLLHRR